MKIIKLTKGALTIVDDEDYILLSKNKWHLHSGGYASCKGTRVNNPKRSSIYMHRLIMGCPKDMEIDHINGNKLDNRRRNLRICTTSQNAMNRTIQSNNTSGHKGVSWCKTHKIWKCYIRKQNKTIHLGHYKNIEDAKKTYVKANKIYHGDFGRIN